MPAAEPKARSKPSAHKVMLWGQRQHVAMLLPLAIFCPRQGWLSTLPHPRWGCAAPNDSRPAAGHPTSRKKIKSRLTPHSFYCGTHLHKGLMNMDIAASRIEKDGLREFGETPPRKLGVVFGIGRPSPEKPRSQYVLSMICLVQKRRSLPQL